MIAIAGLLIPALDLISAAFVDGIGRQLVRKWLPAGVDKAALDQVALKRDELDLRRSEIAAQERRFLLQISEARKLKFDEIEKNREVRRDEEEYKDQLQHWPLRSVRPVDFLRASEARSGRALNIIFAVVDTRDAEFYKNKLGGAINGVLDLFHGGPAQALRSVAAEFGGDVTLYSEVMKASRTAGDSLRSTLWSLLQTEPTVLIEINVVTPSRLKFHVSHWGSSFEPSAPWVTLPPQDIELATLSDPAKLTPESIDQAEAALSIGMSSLVVSLGDTFRALQRPHEIYSPVLPKFVKANAKTLSPGALKPMLATYTAAYDGVAKHSPLLASELAARAASASHSAGQVDFAEILLDKAIRLNPVLRGSTELDAAKLALIRRQRGARGSQLELESALKLIREIAASETQEDIKSSYGDENFEEFVRRFAPLRGK